MRRKKKNLRLVLLYIFFWRFLCETHVKTAIVESLCVGSSSFQRCGRSVARFSSPPLRPTSFLSLLASTIPRLWGNEHLSCISALVCPSGSLEAHSQHNAFGRRTGRRDRLHNQEEIAESCLVCQTATVCTTAVQCSCCASPGRRGVLRRFSATAFQSKTTSHKEQQPERAKEERSTDRSSVHIRRHKAIFALIGVLRGTSGKRTGEKERKALQSWLFARGGEEIWGGSLQGLKTGCLG